MIPITAFLAPILSPLPRPTETKRCVCVHGVTLPRQRRKATHDFQTPLCTAQTSGVAHLREEIANLTGADRGIFGLEDEDRASLDAVIRRLEAETPVPEPTESNARVAHGVWRLIYTNLEILGQKRIKLSIATSRKSGLVKLGDIFQIIDAEKGESRNVVEFEVMGRVKGTFTIEAKYQVESGVRVRVTRKGERLEPDKLEMMLGDNVGLLTDIFNPEGWLEITYIGGGLRIGRDGKGRVFVLERTKE
eukprot:GFKZ01012572.1.p1 GENE.GFKZ01012572.1~~GFKZ01012572.1.p1  ORF type:complete len:248 (+),score=36.40 GFKZ01012572.1:408-1151(+)